MREDVHQNTTISSLVDRAARCYVAQRRLAKHVAPVSAPPSAIVSATVAPAPAHPRNAPLFGHRRVHRVKLRLNVGERRLDARARWVNDECTHEVVPIAETLQLAADNDTPRGTAGQLVLVAHGVHTHAHHTQRGRTSARDVVKVDKASLSIRTASWYPPCTQHHARRRPVSTTRP